jgi:hypothetical protein
MIVPPQSIPARGLLVDHERTAQVRAHLPIEHVKVHIGGHAQGHDPAACTTTSTPPKVSSAASNTAQTATRQPRRPAPRSPGRPCSR